MSLLRNVTIGGAVVAASLTGGALGAGFLGTASASTSSSTAPASTSTGSSSSPYPGAAAAPSMPAHGSAAHEDAEKTVTGANATKAQAAAVKYVGSGTAGTVTTDFTGNGYEVTVTKSDGSTTEVHMDSSFTVQTRGPGGPGGPGGGGPGAGGPSAPSSSTSA